MLGPDAIPVGWVFEYAVVDRSGKHDLSELRSFQDWYLRYQLQTVPGVANVAVVGGYVKQYQVQIDPNRLLAYDLPLSKLIEESIIVGIVCIVFLFHLRSAFVAIFTLPVGILIAMSVRRDGVLHRLDADYHPHAL